MLNLVPPRSFVLSEAINAINNLLTHTQELTSLYFKALCDFQVLLPLLQNIRSITTQINDMSQLIPLANDGVVACCITSILTCLQQVIETTISVGESCLSAVTPTWQWNDHIYGVLHSAYIQTALAVHSARFRHMYCNLPTSSTLTDRELYIIISIFWENMLGYRPEAPVAEVLSSLLVWLDAKVFYDENNLASTTSRSKENFLADITAVALTENISSNDLFCYVHIFNYFLYEKLHAAVSGASLENSLFRLIKEARMSFMDNIFPGILPLKNMTNQTYIRANYRTHKYDSFWLQFEQAPCFKSEIHALIDLPRPEFSKNTTRFGEANILLNEDYIKIQNCHVLEQRLKDKAKPIGGSHDTVLAKSYLDKATQLQGIYTAIIGKLADKDASKIATIQNFYEQNLIILRQLSFCYIPPTLQEDGLSYYLSRLPTPLLDLGIISVPYLAEYLFHKSHNKPTIRSTAGIPQDFEDLMRGVRVFRDIPPPDPNMAQKGTIESILNGLKEIQSKKRVHVDLRYDDLARTDVFPRYTGKDYELSQTVLRTISGTPILLQRYIERECRRALTSVKNLPPKTTMVKICEGIKSSLNNVLDDCYANIVKFNPKYKSSCYTDVVLELFNAGEVSGYETFSKAKITLDLEVEELQSYVLMTFPKLITIYINTAIICGGEFDKEMTKLTQCILPFGGLSCRLAIIYLNKLHSRCSLIDSYLTEGIIGAINALREIIAAKAGYSSSALNRALAFRNLQVRQDAPPLTEGILPGICNGHENRLNYYSHRFKDEILAICTKGKHTDKYYNSETPDLHAHKRSLEQEYMRIRRSKDLYHELGYIPLRTFSLPLVKVTSYLGTTIRDDLSPLIAILKVLPIPLSEALSICHLYAGLILDIPKLLSACLACAELLHLPPNVTGHSAASLMGAFPLSSEFLKRTQSLLSQQYANPAKRNSHLKVVVSGTTGSGVTSLIKFLTLCPLIQYASPLSSAAGEPILFMESHMISNDSNADALPWYLCAEQRVQRVTTSEISSKDTLSIGSWLSCDSAQNTTSPLKNAESLWNKDKLEEILAQNKADVTILYLLREIKGISLLSSALDLFNSGLDDELQVAMDSGKNIREYNEDGTAIVTYNHIAINNNNLFVVIPPEQVSYMQDVDLEPSGVYTNTNIMNLFSTEATNFQPRGLIDYDSSSDYIFHNRYIEDNTTSLPHGPTDRRVVRLSERFDQGVASLADALHAGIINELEQASHLITKEAIVAQGVQDKTQILKKKLPLIDFKFIKHASTSEPMLHSIDLLPLYSSIKIDFLDIPSPYMLPDFTMKLVDENAIMTQKQEDIPSLEQALATLTAKYNNLHKDLFIAVQAIHSLFIAPQSDVAISGLSITPEFLAAQRETATAIVNVQSRQIQLPALEKLIAIVTEQHARASQQFVTENSVIDQFVATLKIQYDKLTAQQPPRQQDIEEYNRQYQLLETRKVSVIAIKNLVESLAKELTTLQQIRTLSPAVSATESDICVVKQKLLKVKECRPMHQEANRRKLTEVQMKRIDDIIASSELFIYVYDCTSSIQQFGVDLQREPNLMDVHQAQIDRLNNQYIDSSIFSDKIIIESLIYKKLSTIKIKVPGLIVCNKCDIIVTNGSTKSFFFGIRLAKLLNWPHLFASSRTGAFINTSLRSAILQNMKLLNDILKTCGTSLNNIYNVPISASSVESTAVPEFLTLLVSSEKGRA